MSATYAAYLNLRRKISVHSTVHGYALLTDNPRRTYEGFFIRNGHIHIVETEAPDNNRLDVYVTTSEVEVTKVTVRSGGKFIFAKNTFYYILSAEGSADKILEIRSGTVNMVADDTVIQPFKYEEGLTVEHNYYHVSTPDYFFFFRQKSEQPTNYQVIYSENSVASINIDPSGKMIMICHIFSDNSMTSHPYFIYGSAGKRPYSVCKDAFVIGERMYVPMYKAKPVTNIDVRFVKEYYPSDDSLLRREWVWLSSVDESYRFSMVKPASHSDRMHRYDAIASLPDIFNNPDHYYTE